jgi:uncharacterized membrane protein YwaF
MTGSVQPQSSAVIGQVQPVFWQSFVVVMIDIAILIALLSWAFSIAKKAWKGEKVEIPGMGGS